MDMHFRMIHEQKFDFVLSFTNAPKKHPFEVGDVYHLKELTLQVLERTLISNILYRTEVSLTCNDEKAQYKHTFTYFEIDNWPSEGFEASKDTKFLVSAMCLIRNEMCLKKSSLKVLVTDTRGGLGASAVFLTMYEMMQEVDEAFTSDNKLKQSVTGVDVFAIVNRLRKDRDRMIEDFPSYKLLFHCLNFYGLNRNKLSQIKPQNEMIETLEDNTIYEECVMTDEHHSYANIEQMSEYLNIPPLPKQDETLEYNPMKETIGPLDDHHKYTNIEQMTEYL